VGIYIVDKPIGLTSFDVVAKARKILNTRRIGHTGTLDPLATGVLVLTVGDSTKLVQFLETDGKDYLAFISLGASTPTLDAEGPILETSTAKTFSRLEVEAVLERFRGEQAQLPPAYSAIHIDGRRAYDLARSGQEVVLPARRVTVHALELKLLLPSMQEFMGLEYRPVSPDDGTGAWSASPNGYGFQFPAPLGTFQTMMLFVSVSSGTYIRSLARDIGAALGVAAHLAGLVRTRVGRFKLTDAVPLEGLGPAGERSDLESLELPVLAVDAKMARDIRDGKRVLHEYAGRAVVTLEGTLVAVVEGSGSQLKVLRAWQG
jgi:tRNA pseudouridine55 synthase